MHRIMASRRSVVLPVIQIFKWKAVFPLLPPAHLQQGIRALSCSSCRCAASPSPLSVFLDSIPAEYSRIHAVLYPNASAAAVVKTAEDSMELKARYQNLQRALPTALVRLKKQSEIQELRIMSEDAAKAGDQELARLALDDVTKTEAAVEQLNDQLVDIMIPEDSADTGDLVIEVTAGAGGQEAMLFADEIFGMYQKYAAFRGWDFEQDEIDTSDIGGCRSASAFITGQDAYRCLKFESGVHRVQRVPKTEKYGRLQTSTVSVAVLPKPRNIDVVLKKSDLKIETCRSSGKGGQNVNKLETKVRIYHLPTNTVVECQEERYQLSNMNRAMEKLAAILYQKQADAQSEKTTSMRKLQTGSKSRSEKIRTYNFPQDRLTDHRIGYTVHGLDELFMGSRKFQALVEQTLAAYRKESLEQLLVADVKGNAGQNTKAAPEKKLQSV